jgi:nucleoside transporter
MYLRLSTLMFLELFVWGAWIVPISGYMNSTLHFDGAEIGWICSASALGALISPLCVGYIADRHMATEKLLCLLHMVSAMCLFAAVRCYDFPALMSVIAIDALFFMPTLSLTNNLVFRHLADGSRFPRVALGGDVGWIVSGLTVGLLLGECTAAFFYLAAAAEALLALYCLTLPHTPPDAQRRADGGQLGGSALGLLKRRAFFIFAIAIPLVTISKTYYTTWANAFLTEISIPKPAAIMTLSQLSEFATLAIMPWFITRFGLKAVLLTGMAAWAGRYALFATMQPASVIAGLLLHGLSYGFIVTGSSMYAARVAPRGMTARAQSLVTLLILGIGMFAGAHVAGYTAQRYQPRLFPVESPAATGAYKPALAPLPQWADLVSHPALRQAVADPRARSTAAFSQPTLALGNQRVRFAVGDLLTALRDIAPGRAVSREQWERLRIHDWRRVWSWAAAIAVAAFLLFWVGGREPTALTGEGNSR